MKKLITGFALGMIAVLGIVGFSSIALQAEELDIEDAVEEVDEDLDLIKADFDALLETEDISVGLAKKIVILAQNDPSLTTEGLVALGEDAVTALFEAAVTEGSITMSDYRTVLSQGQAFMKSIGEGLGAMSGRFENRGAGHHAGDGECPNVPDTDDSEADGVAS